MFKGTPKALTTLHIIKVGSLLTKFCEIIVEKNHQTESVKASLLGLFLFVPFCMHLYASDPMHVGCTFFPPSL